MPRVDEPPLQRGRHATTPGRRSPPRFTPAVPSKDDVRRERRRRIDAAIAAFARVRTLHSGR